MDSLSINSQGGHFAALEELSTHDPIIYTQKWNGQGARPTSSQKDQKKAFFSAKGSSTTITTYTTIYIAKNMHLQKSEAKEELSKKRREEKN